MTKPLTGIRVLDLTSVLMGPYATRVLGATGADVIKVEVPGGDPVRSIGPMETPAMRALFRHVSHSKRGRLLDLKQAAAGDVLLWDHIGTWHCVRPDYRSDEARLMKRCQVLADRIFDPEFTRAALAAQPAALTLRNRVTDAACAAKLDSIAGSQGLPAALSRCAQLISRMTEGEIE